MASVPNTKVGFDRTSKFEDDNHDEVQKVENLPVTKESFVSVYLADWNSEQVMEK